MLFSIVAELLLAALRAEHLLPCSVAPHLGAVPILGHLRRKPPCLAEGSGTRAGPLFAVTVEVGDLNPLFVRHHCRWLERDERKKKQELAQAPRNIKSIIK
jgi:hypothetical protein